MPFALALIGQEQRDKGKKCMIKEKKRSACCSYLLFVSLKKPKRFASKGKQKYAKLPVKKTHGFFFKGSVPSMRSMLLFSLRSLCCFPHGFF